MLLSALNLAFFPLFYFFAFLYYTDVGSTFMVMLMYCLHLDGRDWFASFIGALAVLFRQTNIVWVFFMAIQAAGPYLVGHAHEARMERQTSPATPVRFSLTTYGQLKELCEGLYLMLFSPQKCLTVASRILRTCFGYLMVAVIFVIFVMWNQGVVVGDRSAHQVVLHPMQILYFAAFSLSFSAPYALSRLEPFAEHCKRHWILALSIIMCIVGVIKSYGTIAHPYLLADNRHYTFYIWRRIVMRSEWSAMALTPIYLFGIYGILYSLRRADLAFKLAFPICIIINLVPQYLLEFRYFVIPFMLHRLQLRPQSWWNLGAEFITFQTINVVTLYLFVYHPFHWAHEPESIQRFMW